MKAIVIKNEQLSSKFGYMELHCPEIAGDNHAGRFFMISANKKTPYLTDPILKRPFAVCEVTSPETFTFLYMVVGRGTTLLIDATKGDEFSITGPLGNFFKEEKDSNIALIAGGIGLAPMINLASRLKKLNTKTTLYYGGRSKSDILLYDRLVEICDNVAISTDDGSFGEKGLVIAPFEKRISEYKKVYACGPNRMLMAVTDICVKNNIPIEVSLDEQMGCGVGACLGCMITINSNGVKENKCCCVYGPVFNGALIDWESLLR